jgi:hypothetical protein
VCAAPGALKLLDIFLSPEQKEWIENRTLSLWNRLDEWKKMAFSEFVTQNERGLIVISFLVVLILKATDAYLFHVHFAEELRNPHLDYWFLFAAGTLYFIATVWLGAKLALWALHAKTTKSRLIMLAVLSLPTLPLLIFLGDAALGFYDLPETIYPDIFNLAYFTAGLPVFWAVAVAHLLLIYVAIVFLHIAEFIVRRVAESEKGPILVGSAICAALAALLRPGG